LFTQVDAHVAALVEARLPRSMMNRDKNQEAQPRLPRYLMTSLVSC
jgi:hypothetical protein